MNTRINYVYRDAGNYRIYNECIVPGLMTPSQKQEIQNCCLDRSLFVPSQVGLPENRFDSWSEDDTPFFEVGEPLFEETSEPANVNISIPNLVASFRMEKNRWGCNQYL